MGSAKNENKTLQAKKNLNRLQSAKIAISQNSCLTNIIHLSKYKSFLLANKQLTTMLWCTHYNGKFCF